MLLGQILRIWECSAAPRALAIVFSAAVALLVAVATMPVATPPMVAGAAQMDLMQAEHAVAADYVSVRAQTERDANLVESHERDEMRALARAEVIPLPKPAKPVRIAAGAKTAVTADQPSRPVAAAPLPLQSADVISHPQQAPKGARGVLATVERIPHWAWETVYNAADWAIVGPVQTIVRLPERRFL
jgi:hypothetical protein